jgi:hypothetical protein
MELTTKKLKKMSINELTNVANMYATKLQWLHSTGGQETDPERYKRVALELYHISEIIDQKEAQKKIKPKSNYGKK